MRIVVEDDAACTKNVLCCQDGGEVKLLSVEEVPNILSKAVHNSLGIIYKMEKLPPEEKDASYKFAVATTNGVAVLKVKKKDKAITLDSKLYLKGKVINNLIVSRRSILAFQHEAPHFHLIDRESSKTEEKAWPCNRKSCIIGAQLAPDFHADEMSYIFVRDESTIQLINTQNWLVSELVEVGEGPNFPDLQLFEVTQDSENQITIFTTKGKNNEQLVKRTYSHMLKYCMQTASMKASAMASDPTRGQRTVSDVQRQQTMVARQTTMIGKIMA